MNFRLFPALAAVCALSFSASAFSADASSSSAEGPATLLGVTLGDKISAYPKCRPHATALCWKHFQLEPNGEYVYAFYNIPGRSPVKRFVFARAANGTISDVSLLLKPTNAADTERLTTLMSDTASAKWADWKGPQTLGHVKIKTFWNGPNDAVAGLGKLPDAPNSVLLTLTTQDYVWSHMGEFE